MHCCRTVAPFMARYGNKHTIVRNALYCKQIKIRRGSVCQTLVDYFGIYVMQCAALGASQLISRGVDSRRAGFVQLDRSTGPSVRWSIVENSARHCWPPWSFGLIRICWLLCPSSVRPLAKPTCETLRATCEHVGFCRRER